jgi:hypothetical protein
MSVGKRTSKNLRLSLEWSAVLGIVIALIAGKDLLTKGSIVLLCTVGALALILAFWEHGWFHAPFPIGTPIRALILITFAVVAMGGLGWFVFPSGFPVDSAAKYRADLGKILARLEQRANDKSSPISLPGFSTEALISIHHSRTKTRQYVWDVGNDTGSRESLYISADGLLTYAVSDRKGELYEVRAHMGTGGIPLDEVIFLACQVGITGTGTIISVVVDGKTVATTEVPTRIELDLSNAPGETVGCDIHHNYCGVFILYGLALYSRTLTIPEMEHNAAAFKTYHPGIMYSPPKS